MFKPHKVRDMVSAGAKLMSKAEQMVAAGEATDVDPELN
jgi:hypothetical protein